MDGLRTALHGTRLELSRLQAEHMRLRESIERICEQLRWEPGQECTLAELEAALLWRVGDEEADSVLRAVGG